MNGHDPGTGVLASRVSPSLHVSDGPAPLGIVPVDENTEPYPENVLTIAFHEKHPVIRSPDQDLPCLLEVHIRIFDTPHGHIGDRPSTQVTFHTGPPRKFNGRIQSRIRESESAPGHTGIRENFDTEILGNGETIHPEIPQEAVIFDQPGTLIPHTNLQPGSDKYRTDRRSQNPRAAFDKTVARGPRVL